MTEPAVSVVIPAYNAGRYVGDAISSALAQTRPPAEVIVVDNASTDSTPALLEQFGEQTKVLRVTPNRGIGGARNLGARTSTGDLLAFLDADDVWLPEKLELQVACLLSDDSIGLVHCGIRRADSELRPVEDRTRGLSGDDLAAAMLLHQGTDLLHPSGSTMLVSRAALERVGYFDEELSGAEDWDLTYRIAKSFRIGFVSTPLVTYREHTTNVHRNIPYMERALLRAFEKAFAAGAPDLAPLERRAYANLHLVFAGAYWQSRDLRSFARHSAAALRRRPSHFGYFAALPFRIWRRARQKRASSCAIP